MQPHGLKLPENLIGGAGGLPRWVEVFNAQ